MLVLLRAEPIGKPSLSEAWEPRNKAVLFFEEITPTLWARVHEREEGAEPPGQKRREREAEASARG
jgi:hypothetical protein